MEFHWPIVGHDNIKKLLGMAIKKGKTHHAYIFCGPKQTGKTTLAKYFIKTILCNAEEGKIPCGSCLSCKYFEQGIHPDFHEIKRGSENRTEEIEKTEKIKKNIGIEQIKDAQERLSTFPLLKKKNVALIHDADSLSEKAANALLKTLEEPGRNTLIVLLYTHIKKVIPTIKSRCQVIQFAMIPSSEIYEYLLTRGIERELSRTLSLISSGRPGMALELCTHTQFFDEYKKISSSFTQLVKLPLYERIIKSHEIFHLKKDAVSADQIQNIFTLWMRVARDIFLLKNFSEHLVQNRFILEELTAIARSITHEKIRHIIDEIFDSQKYLKENISPVAVFENFLIQI